nr:hypothetical protein [Tanacetum cinerariifolium]
MDQDSAHTVAAVSMLKPENGETLPKTQVVEGVTKEVPITTAEEKDQRRLEKRDLGNAATKKTQRNLLKKQYKNFTASSLEMLDQTFDRLQTLVSQLEILGEKLSQEDVNQKLLRSLSPEWNTHTVVWRNKSDLDTMSIDGLYSNLKVYEPEVKGMSSSSSSTQNMDFVSSLNNNSSSTNGTFNTAHRDPTASTQVNVAYSTNIDNLSDAIICSFFASQQNSLEIIHEDLEQIHPDNMEEMDLRWKMAMLTIRARRFLKKTRRKLTGNGNETIGFDKPKVECYKYHKRGHFARECRALKIKTTSTKKAQEGVSNQEEEGPNYTLMAFLSSSSDSKKSELMSLGYKTGLKSVEERLESFKTNESIYLEDIKVLKVKIQMKEIAIEELRKKLEIAQKEKDGLQLTVGKIMPPTPDLSYTSLDEFVNKPVVENCKAKSSKE